MKPPPLFPEAASNFAHEVDMFYWLIVGLTIFFSIIVFVPLILLVVKYRKGSKADRSNPVHHHTKLELAWSIIPLMMSVPIFLWAAKIYVDMYSPVEHKNQLEIFVVGKQWMWHLQHPTGQRENNELHVPLNRPVKLTMISQDVIHSFYVPAFRIKRDVLPGRYTSCWFIPTKVGTYHLFCAEFCGTEHAKMGGTVTVMEPEDYEKWLEQNRWGIGNSKPTLTMEQAGEKLFSDLNCKSCHLPNSRGLNVPLAGIYGTERKLSDGRTVTANDDYIRMSIYQPDAMKLAGAEPIMPSFKGIVDEQQMLQLIAYIRTLKTPAIAPKHGEETGKPNESEKR